MKDIHFTDNLNKLTGVKDGDVAITTASTTSASDITDRDKRYVTGSRIGGVWNPATMNPLSPTHTADVVAAGELEILRGQNAVLIRYIKELQSVLKDVPIGDTSFALGSGEMTRAYIEEDLRDRIARYADQGLVLKRMLYTSYEPLYIGVIEGVEVYAAMSYKDRILSLEDLRKATQMFKELDLQSTEGADENAGKD